MAGQVETTNPRPEKVAVVAEVKAKLSSADAVLITEYRGLTVAELAALRSAIRSGGGEYKVYKNTLVRLAAAELELDIDDQLTGPTALAIVTSREGGPTGDIAAVAKALADFAKGQPLLVTKGGLLGQEVLDAAGAKALASLPNASEIYARLAGALNSGARGIAGAVSGVHRSIAYALQACIDAGAFAGDAPPAPDVAEAPEPEAEAVATEDVAPEPEAEAPEPEAVAPEPEAVAEPATAHTDAPAAGDAEIADGDNDQIADGENEQGAHDVEG